MKKRVWHLALAFAILISFNALRAEAIGISPLSIRVNFKSNTQLNVSFVAINPGDNVIKVKVGAGGELAKYVRYNGNESFFLSPGQIQKIDLTIIFPERLEPGSHEIIVGLREIPSEEKEEGISAFGEISGKIIVEVPYPGEYASLSLRGSDANAGEKLNFYLTVKNMGKRTIKLIALNMETFGTDSVPLDTYSDAVRNLDPDEEATITWMPDESHYGPGEYVIKAYGKYNAISTNEEEMAFRIGELRVVVSNYTIIPYSGKIFKFVVQAKSFWNNAISGVFARIAIYNKDGTVMESFDTPTTEISPWGETTISSFWDAKMLEDGKYKTELTLFYAEKQVNAVEEIIVSSDTSKISKALYVALIVLLILFVDYFWLRRKEKKRIRKEDDFRL